MNRADPGSILYLDRNMTAAEEHAIAGGTAAVLTARCPRREGANEDAAALLPFGKDAAALVVADGVGGMRRGEQASSLAIRSIEAALRRGEREGSLLRTAILNGIEEANRALCELAVSSATTVSVVAIEDGRARPYHVGDSMILLVGQRGKIKLQTVSHSPVGFAVEAGVLDEAEALHHAQRHIVSNVLGADDMRIEVGAARKLARRDTLLVASDGVADNLNRQEIVDAIRVGSIEDAAHQLADVASRRMDHPLSDEPSKPDDLTLIVYRRN